MQHPIETERLLLREFTIDDAAAYFPLLSVPDVIKFTGDKPASSIADAETILRDYPLRDYATYGYGRLACIEKASGELIGFSGLKYLEDMKEVDIGYRFVPSAWGKGYATESASAVMSVQPSRFGITRIIGLVKPENTPSVHVLQKLGMAYERQIADPDHGELDVYALALTIPDLDKPA